MRPHSKEIIGVSFNASFAALSGKELFWNFHLWWVIPGERLWKEINVCWENAGTFAKELTVWNQKNIVPDDISTETPLWSWNHTKEDKKLMVQRASQPPCQVAMSHMKLSFVQLQLFSFLTCFLSVHQTLKSFGQSEGLHGCHLPGAVSSTKAPHVRPKTTALPPVPWLGFEPRFLRPQRRVLTTIRSRQAAKGMSEAGFPSRFAEASKHCHLVWAG